MAITGALTEVGAPQGTLVLSGVDQTIIFTCATRNLAYVDIYADDSAMLYAYVALGPYTRIPAGGSNRLPVNQSLTIFVQQDAGFVGATMRAECVG